MYDKLHGEKIIRTAIYIILGLIAGYFGYNANDLEAVLAGPLSVPLMVFAIISFGFWVLQHKRKLTKQKIEFKKNIDDMLQLASWVVVANDSNAPGGSFLIENQSGWSEIELEYRKKFPRPEFMKQRRDTWLVVAIQTHDNSWIFHRVLNTFLGQSQLVADLRQRSQERGLRYDDFRHVTNFPKLIGLAIVGLLLIVALAVFINVQFGIDISQM